MSSLVTPSTSRATWSPEVALEGVEAVLGVLDGVVQQARHQRRRVHAQLGEDRGDGQRVGDVGVAALALLAPVPALGDLVGLLDLAERGSLDLGVVAPDRTQEGSRTGLYGLERCTPSRARRARTRLEEPPEQGRGAGGGSGPGGGPGGRGLGRGRGRFPGRRLHGARRPGRFRRGFGGRGLHGRSGGLRRPGRTESAAGSAGAGSGAFEGAAFSGVAGAATGLSGCRGGG